MLQRKDNSSFSKLEENIHDIYAYVEIIDLSKVYDDKVFIHNFGVGDRAYKWVFHEYNNKLYAATKEIPTTKEFRELLPLCRCVKCASKWYDICSKLKKDTGCLSNNNFSQKVLTDTRSYKHNLLFM